MMTSARTPEPSTISPRSNCVSKGSLNASLEYHVVQQPALAADTIELVVAAVEQRQPEMPGNAFVQEPQPDSLPGRDDELGGLRARIGFWPFTRTVAAGERGGIAGGIISAGVADAVQMAEFDQLVLGFGHAT